MRRIIAVCAALLVAAVMATGASAATATSAKTKASGLDKVYLTNSLSTDLSEIAGGKLALKESSKAGVDSYARTLIADHTKAFIATSKVAKALGVAIPKLPTPLEVWAGAVLAVQPKTTFNRYFLTLEVAGHAQAITLTKAEIAGGGSALAVTDAKINLPVLEKHLRMAEDLLAGRG